MPITTNNFAKALWPGVNLWYGDAYNEFSVEWTDLFETDTSRRAWEEDVGVSGFGLAQIKGEGDSIAYDTATQGFTSRYTHVVYALGFIITREMVEDDLYDVIGKARAKALAFSIRQTKEYLGAAVYNRAFNTSYTGGDGVTLCNTAHPTKAGYSFSNRPAVDADLSEASLEQACIDISKLIDDRGLKINYMPKSLHIPVDLMFEADKILKSEYEVGTANNTPNVVRSRFPGGAKVNHYFSDTDAWFIRTNCPNGLKSFVRVPDKFDTDDDFDTHNAKFQAYFRQSWGWTDPRGIYGTQGA